MDHLNNPAADRPAAAGGTAVRPLSPATIGPRVGRQPACDTGERHIVPPHAGLDYRLCPGSGRFWARCRGGEDHCACCPPAVRRERKCPACPATAGDLRHVRAGNALGRTCPVHGTGAVLAHQGHGPDWDHTWQCPAGERCEWGSLSLTAVLVCHDRNEAQAGPGYLTYAQWNHVWVRRAQTLADAAPPTGAPCPRHPEAEPMLNAGHGAWACLADPASPCWWSTPYRPEGTLVAIPLGYPEGDGYLTAEQASARNLAAAEAAWNEPGQ